MNYDSVNLKELGDIARALQLAEADVVKAEMALSEAKKVRDEFSMVKIPAIMQNAGISEIKIPTGEKLTVSEDVKVSIKKDSQAEAFEFLKSQGLGDTIKTEAVISDPSESDIALLKEWGVTFNENQSVHHATLSASFRDLLGLKKGSIQRVKPEEIPEGFSVYTYKKTKVK